MARTAVTFVIMAGGKGERLWPLVREATPKVCLSPDGRQSLLQRTITRLRPVWPAASWLIVTTRGQADIVRRSLPRRLRRAVLVEPQIKNTAACITLAAVALAARAPHRVMVVVPADHWVGDAPTFRRSILTAIRAAVAQDTIAMIGIRPTHPHSGLGYICAGARLDEFTNPPAFHVERFVEKPSPAAARALLARGRTYWNSGTFVGTADKFLECVTEWLPDHTRRLVPLASELGTASFTRRAIRAYRTLNAVSFDYGVMDHVRGGIVVEGRFPWADLGSWETWARLSRGAARTVSVESRNITVVSQDDHLVATIGMRDLLVVHTPSATLICPPAKSQAVRDVVKRLARGQGLSRYR